MQNKNGLPGIIYFFLDDCGLRNPVIQKKFYAKKRYSTSIDASYRRALVATGNHTRAIQRKNAEAVLALGSRGAQVCLPIPSGWLVGAPAESLCGIQHVASAEDMRGQPRSPKARYNHKSRKAALLP